MANKTDGTSIDTVSLITTIFIAFGSPPVAGIEACLGIAPSLIDEVSLVHAFKKYYDAPTDVTTYYMNF